MPMTVTTHQANGDTLFLIDKDTGAQVDLPLSVAQITAETHFTEVSTAHETVLIPVMGRTNIEISSLWGKNFKSLEGLEIGRRYILNGGVGNQAFHVPTYIDSLNIGAEVGSLWETHIGLFGLGDIVWGHHSPYEVVRFDVGDGTYREVYLAHGETADTVVERWYNRQGQWRW